jgi:hypothetical protein
MTFSVGSKIWRIKNMSTIKKQIEDWLEKKKTHDGQSTNPCGCNFSHFEGMKKGKIISTKM